MSFPTLYAIANIDQLTDPLLYISNLHRAGVKLIQLRSKQLSELDYQQLCEKIIRHFPDADRPKFIINDNPEIARAVKADGVHLGQGDGNLVAARKLLGDAAIIGQSTHNETQLRNAPYAALSYIALGPIFHSQTKSGHAPEIGLENLQHLAKFAQKPLVAIGGITSKNAAAAYRAGASSVAVVQDLLVSDDLVRTVGEFNKAAVR